MDLCLRVLKERDKSRFDSYSVMNSVLIISHTIFWDCRVHFFSGNRSRNVPYNVETMCVLGSQIKFPHVRNAHGYSRYFIIKIFCVVVFAALFNCAERTITNENVHSTVVPDF